MPFVQRPKHDLFRCERQLDHEGDIRLGRRFCMRQFPHFFVLLADAAPPALITLLTFRGDKIIATRSSLSVVKEL